MPWTPTRYNLLDISLLDLAYPLYLSITVPCCVCPPGTTYLTFLFLILPIHSILASRRVPCTSTRYNLPDISLLDLAYPLYPSITVPCCVCPPGTTYLTFLFLTLPIHSILASQYRAVYAHPVQLTWHFFSWSCLSTLSEHHSTVLCTLTRYNLLDISFLDFAYPL